ncbi:MAG: 3-phosphoserine/phosphohydroxythreonine transaminase [Firmicutes bacterium]|jgi:phosphoserine aminotransferase|nr:3-phosphoserine/phosphohydroxythreonine transaminase [Bacillota bacterium]
MVYRIYNFNPGPATLPLPVLEKVQKELLNYRGTGMSILETSHRSKEFGEIVEAAEKQLLELYQLSEDYRVLFLQGGASLQFAMVPLNFLSPQTSADYIITGSFATKAYEEAERITQVNIAASTKNNNYRNIPRQEEIKFSPSSAYVHLTSNNTIYGTQWQYIPDCGEIPLVADMSSDILSRKIEMNKFSLVYAGAQKNLGPAGITAVIIKKEMLEKASETIPAMLSYKVHAKAKSLYNTPTTFAIYILELVLQWIKEKGGLQAVENTNREKCSLIYRVIDKSGGFYRGHAAPEDRSMMNVTFRLPNDDLEKDFVEGAAKEGLSGLKGHRSVGGIRASIYNAMPLEGCEALAQFMEDYLKRNG